MAKQRSVFYCTECGNETPKWVGKCPACGAWNTVVEQEAAPKTRGGRAAPPKSPFRTVKAISLTEVDTTEEIRFSTGMGELNRVLGGGAVKGSLVLVGGAPGVGKSTLMLQICGSLCRENRVLYVSGEESVRQLKLRSQRLGVASENLLVLSETALEDMLQSVSDEEPDILIVDEILAVGDADFQEKSKRRMLELMGGGTTVLFVSHSLGQIQEMCDRVLWLEKGRLKMAGKTETVCAMYQAG